MLSYVLTAILLTISGTAHAQFGPSVFEQMQSESGGKIIGKITKLDISHQNIKVSYKDTEGAITTTSLCAFSPSDQSVLSNQRVESLRQAEKSGEIVELTMNGPWSPCLSSVSALK